MLCPNCGCETPDESGFCQKCGAKLEQKKFCKACGIELASDAVFCSACGTRVEADIPPIPPADTAEPFSYQNVWFVEGERKLMNSPWYVDLALYPDRIECTKKYTVGNPLVGGLAALAVSSAKAKRMESVLIPLASVERVTFAKESKLDAQKLIHIYTKDGKQFHFALTTLKTNHTELIYQQIMVYAQPYLK